MLFSFQLAAWEIFWFEFELRGAEVDEFGAGEDGVIGIHEFGLDERYVAHHLGYVSADGDLIQQGAYGFEVLHVHLGGDAVGLELAAYHPAGGLINQESLNASVQGVLPAFIIMRWLELGYYVISILPEFQMESDGICGAADKAVVPLSPNPRINNLLHI